jgi:predicted Zn finger-like uncharacterized protein
MNVTCPQCSTIYRVDPAKVPPGGVRARCSACGGVIPVGMAMERSRAAAPLYGGVTSSSPMASTPAAPAPQYQEAPRRPSRPTPPRPAALPPLRPTPPTPWPPITPSGPEAAAVQPPQPFVPSQTPVSVPTFTPPSRVVPETGATVSQSTPAEAAAPTSTTSSFLAPSSQATAETSAAASPPQPPVPGERRPVNPFLSRNPDLRAKRLARALVSDMVVYYPAKHSEGLQRGTLKELFRDEIKKSYDEYVAQVGADVARTTTHFQEALNEVLGAGKRIF